MRSEYDANRLLRLGSVTPSGPAQRAALAAYDMKQKRMAARRRQGALLAILLWISVGAAMWCALPQ